MEFQRLNTLAASLMQGRKAHLQREVGSIYDHGLRTAKAVLLLRERLFPGDASHDDTLRAAALFHDVGKGIEPHARYGAVIAREALTGLVAQEEREEIARLIRAHCDRRPEEPLHDDLTRLLQDADLLDHLGTYEIWMNFNYNAHEGKGVGEAYAFMCEEYEPQFARLRPLLNFEWSKDIFDEKIAFMRVFRDRLAVEATGAFIDPDPRS